jgi:hypothetical protein
LIKPALLNLVYFLIGLGTGLILLGAVLLEQENAWLRAEAAHWKVVRQLEREICKEELHPVRIQRGADKLGARP